MKKLLLFISLFILNNSILYSQTVSGKLVNTKGEGLAGLQLQLYVNPNVFTTTSDTDGTFIFQNVTKVEDKILPEGYVISNNYPNPFNPKTRINISLPKSSKVKIELFNTIGQRVNDIIEKELPAGNNFVDLELNGLSNGIYLAKINIDDKYTVTKKLMLIYGSQHLSNSISQINIPLYKSTLDLQIDSLVIIWSATGRKTFTNLPNLGGNTLDLGNLVLEKISSIPCPGIPTVDYSGKTYNTVQIGNQCWLKENLDIGTSINGSSDQTDNGIIEKYCYNDSIENCNIYGGLYQWNEAMQYVTTKGARGICPEGWHIPTFEEFQTLDTLVGFDGNALIAIGQGTGTNTSGFSALLSGYRNIDGSFNDIDHLFIYWSSSELGNDFVYYYLGTCCFFQNKSSGFSIRCLKDEQVAPQPPILLSPSDGVTIESISPTLIWNTSQEATSYSLQVSTDSLFTSYIFDQNSLIDTLQQISALKFGTKYFWRVNAINSYGTSQWSGIWSFTTFVVMGIPCPGIPTVDYSGKTFNTVQIGNQCWLKENLDVGIKIVGTQNQSNNTSIEKYCYDNSDYNCTTYGGLYQWDEAMQYSTTEGAQGICPSGWHIPKLEELQTLSDAVDDKGNALRREDQGSGSINTSGFSAVLAGTRGSDGTFWNSESGAFFWSSTMYDSTYAVHMQPVSSVYFGNTKRIFGLSIRCLKD